MAKSSVSFACQSCGATTAKWSGRCDACGGWNTIVEEGAAIPAGNGARPRVKGRAFALEDLKTEDKEPPRRPTGIAEFDRVAGGGLVPGSALLVGGDPGIGKSTIILQALGKYAQDGGHAIYISGEEAMAQVRMRAARMGLSEAPLLLVGHVTKDGQIAGPKAVEHLVDAVLYFEGERGHHFRVLRAVKNRFGATDEIGVFEMTGKGLAEIANPSALFLGDRKQASPGAAVFAGLEGTRPLLVEVQALVAQP